MTHTATPYKVGRTYDNDGSPETIIAVDGEEGYAVAVALDFGPLHPMQRVHNAEFMVRACNEYYDLVQALCALCDVASESVELDSWPELQEALDSARSILNKEPA